MGSYMKKISSLLILLVLIQVVSAQEIPIPVSYSVLDTVSGDLDHDSINELVVAYNMGPENPVEGVSRELIIYKLENNKWIEWKKSGNALYGSRDGGMMGDPYEQMEIKDGILLISQNGGSSWKWGFTDKYRFQEGDFYLIGYTSLTGKLCEYWQKVDFNLSTGKIIVEKEYQKCETEEEEGVVYKQENETFYKKGLRITLQNRNQKEIKMVSPKFGHEIYISTAEE